MDESLVSPFRFEDKVSVPEIDLGNFSGLVYGQEEDIVICFYNSQHQGMSETDDFLSVLEKLAAKMQQERIKIFNIDIYLTYVVSDIPPKSLKYNPLQQCFCYLKSIQSITLFP